MNQLTLLLPLFSIAAILSIYSCKTQDSPQKMVEPSSPYTLAKDILWASPQGHDLTMDIYTPNTGKASYPVIVMFHGGGWLINDNSIMRQSAEYLATHGEYVVCNVNYRLLGDLNNSVTLDNIVEDAFGAVLWVKAHVKSYKGDADRMIVTGDSAGGHLATMVTTQGEQLSSQGFDNTPLGFTPTWLPQGKSAEAVAKENGLAVEAAIISYGAFDLYNTVKNGFEKPENGFWSMVNAEPRGIMGREYNYTDHAELYQKVSPIYNIPLATDKVLPPMLFTVGSLDNVTTPQSIEEYIAKLRDAGHMGIEYWIHKDRPHAFLDSGSNPFLNIKFEDDAIPALEKMISYLDAIFYK